MAHFGLTRMSWPTGTEITQANIENIDSKTFRAINGDDGGTWAPAAAINIGGAGLDIDGPVDISNTITHSGNAQWAGVVDISAANFVLADLGGHLFIDSDVYLRSAVDLINPGNNLTIGDGTNANEIQIAANAFGRVLNGGELVVDSGGKLDIDGTLVLGGNAQSMSTKIQSTGTGRICKRLHPGTDADINVGINDGDIILVPALTADRVYTLVTTDATVGDTIKIVATGIACAFKASVTINATLFPLRLAASHWRSVTAYYNGASWIPCDATPFDA